MQFANFVEQVRSKYMSDQVALRDLISKARSDLFRAGRQMFREAVDAAHEYGNSIENIKERIAFKQGIRAEAQENKKSIIEHLAYSLGEAGAESSVEEAEAYAEQLFQRYFGDPLEVYRVIEKNYIPIHGEPYLAISAYIQDAGIELLRGFRTLGLSIHSGPGAARLAQLHKDWATKAINLVTEIYAEGAGLPREESSFPDLAHVPLQLTSSKRHEALMTFKLSKKAQDPMAPAHIVKHDYQYMINVTYMKAPTKDPRTRQRVKDPRTGQASTPYYVFIRVDKVPTGVRPGEASAPQTDIYRYKMPAKSSGEAQRLARAKITELQRALKNVKVGKPTHGTLPYPFGLMSTPELDAPDKPLMGAAASLTVKAENEKEDYMSTQNISAIYDKARDLEDVVHEMRGKGERLDDWIEDKLSRMADDISEVHDCLIHGKKRASLLPQILRLAHDLDEAGHGSFAAEMDRLAADFKSE